MYLEAGRFKGKDRVIRDCERETTKLQVDFPVRPHHFDLHVEFVNWIYDTKTPDPKRISYSYAKAITQTVEASNIPNFREKYGRSVDDSSVPEDYPTDVNGTIPDDTTGRFAETFEEFFTRSEDAITNVGPTMDAFCKGCAFGDGQGGLHCRTYDLGGEDDETLIIGKNTRDYLRSESAEAVNAQSPGKLWLRSEFVHVPESFRVEYGSKNRLVTQLFMPFQLYRDVVTEFAFRDRTDGNNLTTFPALLAHKGIEISW